MKTSNESKQQDINPGQKVAFHDPREYVRGLRQIFISDKKKIAFLFGAGASFATGIPTVCMPAVAAMTVEVVQSLKKHSNEVKVALEQIEGEIGSQRFTIESLLSTLEAKTDVIGSGQLNGLSLKDFQHLITKVKTEIKNLASVHTKLDAGNISGLAHCKVSSWIAKAQRRYPAEIYTTNYDYLFEIALEHFGIPYFDGFAGSFEPFFCPEAVEDFTAYSRLVKLWKLHGSLGWKRRKTDEMVIRDKSVLAEDLMIFPSHLKYNNSKKQPYVGLIDRLCNFLQQDDAILITSGYSFGDRHINERIATSLRRGGNSHVIAMYYDEVAVGGSSSFRLTDSNDNVRVMATHETSGKMSVYGMKHAVIGGTFGEWRLRDKPRGDELQHVEEYFNFIRPHSNEASEEKENDKWDGLGKFLLPDFCRLAEFLNSLTPASAGDEG